ncbi:MAG: exodeoxyribonuclease VII small subunit [Thermodesulfobacteriota bacterium]|nr:exodeoxyribonuclease VII small subunit [Thermodesulfobacteriota bacterium]
MAAKKTFEQSLKELEEIVEAIESGELPLETALSKFETGVKLSETCAKKLDEAEQKISLLMKDKDGNFTNHPFAEDDGQE